MSDSAPPHSPTPFPALGTVLRTPGPAASPKEEVERTHGSRSGLAGGGLGAWALGPRSAGKRAGAGGVARTEPVELRAARAWARASHHPATAWTRAPADLQVGDVPVDVHGGRHAVLRHVLVVAGARLTIHTIDAGDGDPLIAPSDVPATGRGEGGARVSSRRAQLPPAPAPP